MKGDKQVTHFADETTLSRLQKLEAENKRLREALNRLCDHLAELDEKSTDR